MFMNLNNRGRILGVAFALAVIIPASMAQAAAGRGNGGGGGGGGGDGGGDGAGARGISPIEFARDPNCHGRRCGEQPKITYIKKNDACEIRTCEVEDGVRKCSSEFEDIKVCLTKRS